MEYLIVYIENIDQIPEVIKKTVEEFFKKKTKDLEFHPLIKNIKDGFDAIREFDTFMNNRSADNILVICEASIPTVGDFNIVVKHIRENYQKIKIGVVSRTFSSDLEEYPIDYNTRIPAARFDNADSIKSMLEKLCK